MPTPPTITTLMDVIGGDPYGTRTAEETTTWGKTRCTLIEDYNGWSKGTNSLIIDGGWYPTDGLHIRVDAWPYTTTWFDSLNFSHTEYIGPFAGYQDGAGVANSYISVGAYDWSGNDTNNPYYTSVNNSLDKVDIDNFFTGLTVNSTYTTTADWTDTTQTGPNWFGQSLGTTAFTGYTTISDMTAF
jgi:hypothetical protein